MVAIRHRAIPLLAVGLLVAGGAFAQDAEIECVVRGVPQIVRAEGKTELLGDVTFRCNASDGTLPSNPTEHVNITLDVSNEVTNNIDFDSFGGIDYDDEIIDSVLIVNGEDCVTPSALGSDHACSGIYQDPQFGRLLTGTRVTWSNVEIPFPGVGGNPDQTTIRISSLRANAAASGIPSAGSFPITADVSVEPPQTLRLDQFSVLIGRSQVGLLSLGVTNSINGLQCVDLPAVSDEEEGTYITIREGFASAFKTQGFPSNAVGRFWESGYYAPESNNDAGASQETQFLLSFSDIPADVSLSVYESITNTAGTLRLTLLDDDLDCGDGPLNPSAVSLDSDGNGSVIYRVCDNAPGAFETINIPLLTEWALEDTPDVGAGTVTISFYPLGGSDSADLDDPEPRFVDTSTSPEEFISVSKCVTTLLFPFVSNQSGFDTGLAISNTSEDWGLSAIDGQDGGCEIHYIGTDSSGNMFPDADVTTEDIAAGEQLVWLLSNGGSNGLVGAPDFQGYVLAACDFQYAHGYAFITDGFGGGIPALAQGYLALVIPADRAIANGAAESLGN